MKKAVLLFIFFCVSVLCCLADEKEQTGENNNALPLFPYSGGLSTQTSVFGFSITNPVLSTDSLIWKQADLGLTKYADYEKKSFFEASKPVFQWILIIGGGIAMATAGILGAADANSDYMVNITIFTLGLTATAGGIVWFVLDP